MILDSQRRQRGTLFPLSPVSEAEFQYSLNGCNGNGAPAVLVNWRVITSIFSVRACEYFPAGLLQKLAQPYAGFFQY